MTPRGREAVVLGYHRVGPPPEGSWETWFSVGEETFLDQLQALVDAGWQPVDAGTFVTGLAEPDRLPPRTSLVTFDDAFKTLTGSARACLARFGLPGVVFVPVGHVGGTNEWDADSAQPRESICSWDDLRALDRAGISIQSHGVSHRGFSTLDHETLARELEGSKRTLERELGTRVDLLAYPYGDAGAGEVRTLAERARYRAGFLYRGGPFRLPVDDPFSLPRIPMGPDTDIEAALAQTA